MQGSADGTSRQVLAMHENQMQLPAPGFDPIQALLLHMLIVIGAHSLSFSVFSSLYLPLSDSQSDKQAFLFNLLVWGYGLTPVIIEGRTYEMCIKDIREKKNENT